MGNWANLQFYHSGDAYFEEIIRAIRNAQKKIQIETYIFEVDPLTEMILLELEKAQRRGCDAQLMIDGFGSFYWQENLRQICSKKNLSLRVFNPLPRGIFGLHRWMSIVKFKFFKLLRKLNRRNHRKTVLIDGKVAYIGSFNFTQVHSEMRMKSAAWRDSAVRLEGPSVRDIEVAFVTAWRRSERSLLRGMVSRSLHVSDYNPRTSLVRLSTSRRTRSFLMRDFLKRIRHSENRILITTAYFLPKMSSIRALCKAADRGIDVQIIIPGPSDVKLVKWASFHLLRKLVNHGVKIYEYQNRVMHAKYQIIDGWSTLGSLNWNHRSAFLDLESEAVFTDPEVVESLAAQWQIDRKFSKPLTKNELAKSTANRLLFWIFYRFRFLL